MFKKTEAVFLTVFTITILVVMIGSIGSVEARTVKMSWNANPEPDIAGYRIYWGTTHAQAFSKSNLLIDVGNRTSACVEMNESIYNVIFLGVTAYNTQGLESDATVGYVLFGNIVGDYNNGTPYQSARIDGFDLNALGIHFGKTVTHPSYNCASGFVLQIQTEEQRCDFNKDGRIDGFDLIYLGLRWGNDARF